MNRKKIIIGFGGSASDKQEIDFIFKFFPHRDMLFVGAVINGLEDVPQVLACKGSNCSGDSMACVQKKEKKARQSIYNCLAEKCEESGSRCIIHKEDGCRPDELIKETHYADMLVISQQTYRARIKSEPGEAQVPFGRLLVKCACPVLVLPENSSDIEQVVMTFDGSSHAMQGIKQFSYLLPELGNSLPITILTTYHETEPSVLDEKLFIEYLKQHFSNLAIHKLNNETAHTIYSAVGLNINTLMVVNNPSPQNLPMISNLVDAEDSLVPFKLFTQIF